MSLLLDALKNASTRKDEIAKESNQTTPIDQDRDSSQKLAASFFRNSENNSLLSLSNPLLIAVLTLVVIISGTYWWQLHSVSAEKMALSSQNISSKTASYIDLKENKELPASVAPAIPDIVIAAVELESINSLVDQMQSEHASTMANEEQKRKKLETILSEKTKALNNAEQQIISLNTRIKTLEDKTKAQNIAEQELNKSLDERTQTLALAEQNVTQLNAQIKKGELEIKQFEEKLATAETSNKQLQQVYDEEKAALTNQLDFLQEENKTIRDEQILASANVAKIQKIQDTIFLQLKDEYKNARGKIKGYERNIQQAKQMSSKKIAPNPKEGISLKLDMQLDAIGNR